MAAPPRPRDPRRQPPLPRRGGRRLRRQVGDRLRGRRRGAGARQALEAARRAARARTRARSRSARAPATSRSTSCGPASSAMPPARTSRPGMLEALEANARRLGLDVETAACDAAELPFEDASFDLVFGHAVLHHLPALERSFAEFARVLRPGGTLFFAGEPSRQGDRIAAWPKRAAMRAAPLWRRAVRARPADYGHANGGPPRPEDAEHALESVVDVHAFDPADLRAADGRRRAGRRPRPGRGAARELVRLVQPHARGERAPRRHPVAVVPVRLPRLPRAPARRPRAARAAPAARRSSTT